MSNLHRGHSIDDSYQVLVVAMFVNRSGRNEQSHRGHSIDASYQVRFIWPSGFRREDLKKSANQKQELPVAAMFGNES
jgi:hypothetical protein